MTGSVIPTTCAVRLLNLSTFSHRGLAISYGRNPLSSSVSSSTAFDTQSYPAHLRAKLAELHDLVESNLQKQPAAKMHSYDKHTSPPSFTVGDTVWLSIPTAGKLDPKLEGGWSIKAVKSPVTMEINNRRNTRIVHTNRLRHCKVPSHVETLTNTPVTNPPPWDSPTIDHLYIPPPPPITPRRYPQRHRRPLDRYGF